MAVEAADGTRVEVLLAGDGPPDLAVVEALARFQLMARRVGYRVWLEDVSAALGDLLDLTGLREAVTSQPSPRQEAADQPGPSGTEPRAGP